MNRRSFIHCLCRSSIIPHTAVALVMLVELAWSAPSFCAEIHDAAKNGDLAKVQALVRHNPDLVFSKDKDGETPLHLAADYDHKDVAGFRLAHRSISSL